MLCTDKGSTVQAQSVFWMDWVMVWHACSIPLLWDDPTQVVRVYYPRQVFIIDWLLMFLNQTQVGAGRKVPFAHSNTSHIANVYSRHITIFVKCLLGRGRGWIRSFTGNFDGSLNLMQPSSMGTLNSPSSRVVKDLTILRCINLAIRVKSSPNLFWIWWIFT